MLNKAVTLYRLVFLLVRRRMLPGELGSVNVDMVGERKGNLQSWWGDWYRPTMRPFGTRRFAAWQKRRKGDPGNMILGGGGCTDEEGREG